MPVLERLGRTRVCARPAALDGGHLAASGDPVSGSARTRRSCIAPRGEPWTTATRSSARRRLGRLLWPRRGRPSRSPRATRVAAAGRPARTGAGAIAGVPVMIWLAPRRRLARTSVPWSPGALRGRARGAAGVNEFVETPDHAPLAACAAATLRRRDRRRRRPWPRDGVLPGDAPRHHERVRARGRLHRRRATPGATRPSSGPTTASPRRSRFYQRSLDLYAGLEDELGPAILHAPRASSGWPTPRWPLPGRAARATMNTACGAETEIVGAGRDQAAHPAARPVRRWPVPRARRLATTPAARPHGTTASSGATPRGRFARASTSSRARE